MDEKYTVAGEIDISFINELPLLLQTRTLKTAALVKNEAGELCPAVTFADGSRAIREKAATRIYYAA